MNWKRQPILWALFVLIVSPWNAQAEDLSSASPDRCSPWTLDEALQQLSFYPHDAYLQYVAMQLARREGGSALARTTNRLRRLTGRSTPSTSRRRDQVDLFSLTTGALAVQESLQLDAMAVTGARQARGIEMIDVETLQGPTVRSHPFQKMLAGRRPKVSPLAMAVPEDFYYVRFHSIGKLLDVTHSAHLWSTHLFSQSGHHAFTHQTDERIRAQLCVETNPILQPFYDLVVREVAIVGSDLFLREGSDVTLLFGFQQEVVFKARMDGFLVKAENSRSDVRRTDGVYRGVPFVHLASPDREIHVFSAYPRKGLHVRSNSRVALERIIDTIQCGSAAGRDADPTSKTVQPLGRAPEFLYMRTLFESSASEEDGFIYLSDAFIRRLVGPVSKLTERRRLLCYNHLRMIQHAALLYRTEHGKAAKNLAELIDSKCLPAGFGEGHLACSQDGHYTLSADGTRGYCSMHGRTEYMTPCCELPVTRITSTERDLYKQFLTGYNRYWRTYFDPIGIRIQATPRAFRLETIILPLIDNSIYSAMAQVLGGKPAALDNLPVTGRDIFSVAMKFDKEKLFPSGTSQLPQRTEWNRLREIGLAFHNYHDTFKRFPPGQEHLGAQLSWRVHLLPFLQEHALYEKFKMDESWDSPHNKPLLKQMPRIYGENGTTTRIMGFSGKQAPFGKSRGLRFRDIQDGTSNTILVVEAGPDKAVPWTKPADLAFDAENPVAALGKISPEGITMLMMDGSVVFLSAPITAKRLKGLVTYNGQEVVQSVPRVLNARRRQRRAAIDPNAVAQMLSELGASKKEIAELGLGEFLLKGIGDQLSIHICDAEPTFSFSIPRFFGAAMNWGGGFGDEFLMVALLANSLNSPLYMAIPVEDAKIVDDFLDRLDPILAKAARVPRRTFFFSIKNDFYQIPDLGEHVRCFAIEMFSFRFRLFIARVGNGLYFATQPKTIHDLRQAYKNLDVKRDASPDEVAHLLVRIRPKNWNRVLGDYQLGWAEANRESCLNNVGPLSDVARAYGGQGSNLLDVASQLNCVRYFCPDGGKYKIESIDAGTASRHLAVHCTLHGTAQTPQQSAAPAASGQLGRLLAKLKGVTTALTFTKDGLRAVLRIDRQPEPTTRPHR